MSHTSHLLRSASKAGLQVRWGWFSVGTVDSGLEDRWRKRKTLLLGSNGDHHHHRRHHRHHRHHKDGDNSDGETIG